MRMTIRSFTAGALLKLGCLGLGTFWLLLGVAFGLFALFGIFPVMVNGTPTFGISGLFAGLLLGVVFAGIQTIAFMIGGLVARFIPKVRNAEIKTEEPLPD